MKGGYIGDYMGEYSRDIEGDIPEGLTIVHMVKIRMGDLGCRIWGFGGV